MGPNMIGLTHPRLVMAGLLTLIGFGGLFSTATAQDEAEVEGTTLTAYINLCLDAGCTELAEAIEPADGVGLEISDPSTGDILGACVTGDLDAGACAIEVPLVESVSVLIDEATVPEGYVTDGNPTEVPLDLESGDAPVVSLLLYPADGFPQAEAPVEDLASPEADSGDDSANDTEVAGDDAAVAALPDTGSGSGDDSTAIVLTASALAAATLGLAAIGVRRVVGRNET